MVAVTFGERIGFSGPSVFDIEKVTLNNDERARIVLLTKEVEMEYTHFIKGDGDSYKGGQYICLGNFEKLKESGRDSANCPACAAMLRKENGYGKDSIVSIPKRRFVSPVARYTTSPNSGKVSLPISLRNQVWIYTDSKFDKLFERQETHGPLENLDILLRCTEKQFQTFDIDVDPKQMFRDDPRAVAMFEDLIENIHPELKKFLGRKMTEDELEAIVSSSLPLSTSMRTQETAPMMDSVLKKFGVTDAVDAEDEDATAENATVDSGWSIDDFLKS